MRRHEQLPADLGLALLLAAVTFALAYPACVALSAVLLQTAPTHGEKNGVMETSAKSKCATGHYTAPYSNVVRVEYRGLAGATWHYLLNDIVTCSSAMTCYITPYIDSNSAVVVHLVVLV
jgi:hypothetical protein